MADIDLSTITEPISEEEPCGPDLDMESEDFWTFEAEVGGILPARFFDFDPKSIDYEKFYELIGDLLAKARDLRLLIPLAKLRILQGNMDGFIDVLSAVATLCKDFWLDVHPQDPDVRIMQVSTLDDNPNSVLPFQHSILFRSDRHGPITLRRWQLATGEVKPREGEEVIDSGTILGAFREHDSDEVKALGAKFSGLKETLNAIRMVFVTEAMGSAPSLEKLNTSVDQLIDMIRQGGGLPDQAGVEGEESEAPQDGAASAPGGQQVTVVLPTGAIQSREDAVEALFQAERCLAEKEPSSPVILLLREARKAANLSFSELVKQLLPSSAGDAFVQLGREPWFEVPLKDLQSRNPQPDYDAADDPKSKKEAAGLDDELTEDVPRTTEDAVGDSPESGDAADADAQAATEEAEGDESAGGEAAEDGDNSEEVVDEQAAEPDADESPAEDGATAEESEPDENVAEAEAAEEAPAEAPPEQPVEAEEVPPPAAEPEPSAAVEVKETKEAEPVNDKPRFHAENRAQALALIDMVLKYYRTAEPSSPVALILERAQEMSSKNFIGLLQEVLPEGHLRDRESPVEPNPKKKK